MRWVEFKAVLSREAIEAASAAFRDVGAVGVSVEDPGGGPPPGTWDYWDPPEPGPASVMAWFPAELAEDKRVALELRLEPVRRVFGSVELVETLRDEEAWTRIWWRALRPRKVGPFRVVPDGATLRERPGEQVLHLVEGQAFGTGDHATTALCVEALSRLVRGGERVLDVGTGSGILAVAARLLGAGQVLAMDNDPEAIRVARENARRNAVDVEVRLADFRAEPLPGADLVVANLTPDLVLQLAPAARRALDRGGFFVASGIGVARLPEVAGALRAAGFIPAMRRRREWGLVEGRV